jgi:hypothetical protein
VLDLVEFSSLEQQQVVLAQKDSLSCGAHWSTGRCGVFSDPSRGHREGAAAGAGSFQGRAAAGASGCMAGAGEGGLVKVPTPFIHSKVGPGPSLSPSRLVAKWGLAAFWRSCRCQGTEGDLVLLLLIGLLIDEFEGFMVDGC